MVKYLKIILPLLLVCVSYQKADAQNYGILGRKFLGKLVIANGIQPLNLNVEGEYVFHKRMSITCGLGINTVNMSQHYYIQGKREYNFVLHQFEIDNNKYELKETEKSTRINSAFISLQYSFYLTNHLLSAPNGFYLSARGVAGLASMNSESGYAMVNPLNYAEGSQVAPFKLGYIFYYKAEAGFGFQKLLGKRWTIDGSVFFNFTQFNPDGSTESKQYTGTVAKEYGPNVMSFNNDYRSSLPPASGVDQSMGISCYFKIGYFIF